MRNHLPPVTPVVDVTLERRRVQRAAIAAGGTIRQGVPLSFAQQRLWFVTKLDSGTLSYNVPLCLRLTGELDIAALERSLGEIIRRHEVLRTTYPEVAGRPEQRVAAELPIELRVDARDGRPEHAWAHIINEWANHEARRPFDLAHGPMVRIRLLRLAASEHVLLLVMHHIVCDGWSIAVLLRELGTFYGDFRRGSRHSAPAATQPALPALAVQYGDFSVWQRGWLQGEVLDAQLAYWTRQLAGAPPVLALPTDRPRPPVRRSRGASVRATIPAGVVSSLREVCAGERVTLFMGLFAAYAALLSRYSGQADLVIGSLIAGRNRRQLEPLIGFFVNSIALRVEVSPDLRFRDLLRRVRETCAGAYAHQDLPFERLVDALKPERTLSHTPVFQVDFVLQNAPPAALDLPGISASLVDVDLETSKLDVSVIAQETPAGVVTTWTYDVDLFDAATMSRMAAHYVHLLAGAAADPAARVTDLPLVSARERRDQLVAWGSAVTAYPRETLWPQVFEAACARHPDRVAVEAEHAQLTYLQLNERANQLAHRLRARGVRPDDRIGICLERSLDMFVGLLAILKAGGAYVPLDPGYPEERLAWMVEDSQAVLILSRTSLVARLPIALAKVPWLELADDALAGEPRGNPEALSAALAGDALAYVIYTSGSTGRPKGVALSNHGLACSTLARADYYGVRGERFLLLSSLSFDSSVAGIFGTLARGGTLVVVSAETQQDLRGLARGIAARRVSHFLCVPSLYAALLPELEALRPPALEGVIVAGEPCGPALVARHHEMFPDAALWNEYGPTEAAVWSSVHKTDARRDRDVVPIGRAAPHVALYVLDHALEPVPQGLAGELYVGGAGLARGYLGRPDLTAARFLPHPFSDEPGARLYRTGDLVKYNAAGQLEFLGRADGQIKLRGYRIELAEVEAVLTMCPGVQVAAATAAREGQAGNARLIAYVVPAPGEPPPKATALRAFLAERLPDYMVPSVFVVRDALPMLPNGKLDRAALPAPRGDEAAADEANEAPETAPEMAPETAIELALAELWAQLLGVPRVGARENFFELGGHSLLAMQLVSRVRAVLGFELAVRTVFEAPTLGELAGRLSNQLAGGATRPPLVASPPGAEAPLSFAQQRLWFLSQLAPGEFAYHVPVFLRLEGALDAAALAHSLDDLIGRHAVLRTTFVRRANQPAAPVQHIAGAAPFALVVEDLEVVAEGVRWAVVEERARQEARVPFDLETGPLVRARLLRLAARDHVVLLVVHHIVCDGWSMGVLLRELGALYAAHVAGTPSELPPLAVQYADFASWQRELLGSAAASDSLAARQLSYWREALQGLPERVALPTDRPYPAVADYRAQTLRFELDPALHAGLRELAREARASLYMVLQAALAALLTRMGAGTDIPLGSAVAGRTDAALEQLVGFFVNTLVLRTDTAGNPTFRELLGRVRATDLAAYVHQEVPFEWVVEAVRPARSLAGNPLFQVMLVLQNTPEAALRLPGVAVSALPVALEHTKFDVTVDLTEHLRPDGAAGGLTGRIEYRCDLFNAETIEAFAARLVQLYRAIVADPGQRIGQLDVLLPAERARLVAPAAQAGGPDEGAALPALFEAQVRRTPDALALSGPGGELTYAELNARANRVAHRLIALGAGPEQLIGLAMPRSVELVVALLGVLKAGAAYLPLDPDYPAERLAFMLADARPLAVLGSAERAVALPAERVIVLDAPGVLAELAALPASDPTDDDRGACLCAAHPAYVIYTSGSTGRPKGVVIPHRNVARLFASTEPWFGFGPDDVWTLFHSPAFDFSVWEIWGPLLHGGRLVIVPRAIGRSSGELLDLLARERVTVLSQTPSAFFQLAQADHDEPARGAELALRTVIFGGEALELRKLAGWYARHPVVPALVNMYGITETTVHVSYRALDRDTAANATESLIGAAIPDLRMYVLGGDLAPVPTGVVGEIFVAGAGLARGYLNRPALTAERFLPDPFGPPGSRMYRTGDLARLRADGELAYLGRRDDQVKLRGFRIELGEVGAAMAAHPEVAQAGVILREDRPGDPRLVAYVVPATGAVLDPRALRRHAAERLPEHMVPSAVVVLDRMPLTAHGKLDRKALPAPAIDGTATRRAPITPVQAILCDVVAEVVGVAEVGVDDNFFELGGHSLLATRLVSRIRTVLGVELGVRAVFEAPVVGELANRLDGSRAGTRPALVARQPGAELPLSFAQQRLWFLAQLAPGGIAYNVPLVLRVEGALEAGVLARCLDDLIARHEVLRTSFAGRDGQPVQQIAAAGRCELVVEDLDGVACALRWAAVEARARQEATGPFDLETGPLVRARLLRLAARDHVVLVVMHHIVCDGWSMEVLLHELEALYAAHLTGVEPALPALAVQYADFARWQRQWLVGGERDAQLRYWTQQLAGAPAVLELPLDRPRPRTQSFHGAYLTVPIGGDVARGLRALGRAEGVTLFMTLLAAYDVLLWRYTGQRDVVVGSPIAGRMVSEVEPLIGFFVNTLVLRVRLAPQRSFRALLGRVREVCLGGYAHQDLPFEQLVDALNPVRNLSHPPVFQVAFTLQNLPPAGRELSGARVTAMDIDLGIAKFDLTLTVRETAGELLCAWEYNTDLFDAASVVRMAGHYLRLVEAAVAEPDLPVARLPFIDAAERHQLVVAWNPAPALVGELFPHERFERQAQATPEAPAVIDGATELTYGELDRRANRLAWHLAELGAGPDVVVALCLDRSADMLIALLAVLKAGAAYLPLDPGHPAARVQFTLDDSAAAIAIVHARHEPLVAGPPGGRARIVCLDRDRIASGPGDEVAPARRATGEHLGYVIYTSGSTGTPKGAELRLTSLANVVGDMVTRLGLGPADRWVAATTLAFDIATLEMLAPLVSGGTLVIATREQATRGSELRALIETSGGTIFQGTPSTYRLLLEAGLGRQPLQVRRWVCGGERVLADLVDRMAACGGQLINGYGPTETTIYSTVGELDPSAITIGRPVANTRIYILSDDLALQPIGVAGEIWIGGEGLGRGYRHRPALTAERFVPDPFGARPGARMYRTGDLGRWRADGRIECLGRTDDQVKVRGHRIELGEIESALANHPGVAACAAAVREDAPGDMRLIAYLVPRDGVAAPGAPELRDLRAWLRTSLPEYMMPSRFVTLAALPYTPSGKVDRNALPAPDAERDQATFVAPRAGLEAELAAIWAEVLRLGEGGRVGQVGVTDNFFDLGGNSLLLQTVHTRIETRLGRQVPLVELFEFSTIAALAAHLAPGPSAPGASATGDPAAGDANPPGHGDDRSQGLRQLAAKRRGGTDASR